MRHDVDTPSRPVEAHLAINEGKDGVITPEPHVLAGQKFRSPLPDDDIARNDCFAPKSFHAKTFADAVPSILYAALSFFVCHCWKWRVESLMVESGERRRSGFFLYLCFLLFRRFLAEADSSDLDAGQLAAMADRPVIAFPATIFERDHFLILALFDDLAGNSGAFDQRVPMGKLLAIAVKKYIGKNAFFSSVFLEEVHINDVAFGNAMLSASCFDNCVGHKKGNASGGKPRKVPQLRRFDKRKTNGVDLTMEIPNRKPQIPRKSQGC